MTDWIMIAITLVYVIATIAISYFNAQSANAAKKQIEEMIFQREQMDRPYISIHFEIIRSGLMCFVIENIGSQPAFDVKIELNEAFIENIGETSKKEYLQKLNDSSTYFAIKQKAVVFIDSQMEFNNIAKEKAIFLISYNHKYEERLEIDINQYNWMLIYTSPTEDISQHLKKMKEDQTKFQNDLLKQLKNIDTANPLNVVVHPASEQDTSKLRVLKTVSINVHPTLKTISEQVNLSLEETHNLLVELMWVDHLVGTYISENWAEVREDMVWFKK